jgi:hypothetical protein
MQPGLAGNAGWENVHPVAWSCKRALLDGIGRLFPLSDVVDRVKDDRKTGAGQFGFCAKKGGNHAEWIHGWVRGRGLFGGDAGAGGVCL